MSTLYRRKDSPFVWIQFTDQWGRRQTRSTKVRFDVRSGRWIIPHVAREIQHKIDLEVSLQVWDLKPKHKSPLLSVVLGGYLSSAGSNLRPNSRRCKVLAVRQLTSYLGDVPIGSVTREQLFAWKETLLKKNISPHTAASWIREVSPLFRGAVDEGVLDRSPVVRGFKMNPPVHPPAIYTEQEFEGILDAARARPHLHAALSFLWETGFRVGEMTELRWERPGKGEYWGYPDFDANTIHVWNQKERRFDVYPMKGVKGMLEALRDETEEGYSVAPKKVVRLWVFPAAQGGKLDPARFGRDLKQIVRRLGINPELTVHSIRKSYCSRLITQGVDFGTVHKLMRHRDPATTMRYYAQFQLSTLEEGQSKGSTRPTIPLRSDVDEEKGAEILS